MAYRWHRWVDHTSEVQLEVEAESPAGLAAEAGRALGLLMLRGAPPAAAGPAPTLEVSSGDREALPVDWLHEILFVAASERWGPAAFAGAGSASRPLRITA